eukprot:c27205_g1_i1 orf=237-1910(+)
MYDQKVVGVKKNMPKCKFTLSLLFQLSSFFVAVLLDPAAGQTVSPGSWQLLVENGGISAMHMTLTRANTVIMFDRTDYGPSDIKLPGGTCRNDPNDLALKVDCYAHSIEFNLANNAIRPLEVLTDTWCSSGAFTSDGTLVSTGGYNDGGQAIRLFDACSNGACDWNELSTKMGATRWYASNQILPDNTIIVVGGRRSFSYEFVPSSGQGAISFPFLTQTNVPNVENNLYPFIHLSSDSNLFIFANKDSILFNYKENTVVKTFPTLPDGSRNYPSSGSSVMLPLSASDNFQRVEIMICGGAPDESALQASKNGIFQTAIQSCGRMVITDANPGWAMEDMPTARVMGDMLILPTGEILIINGAQQGTAGWGYARNPSFAPFLYRPTDEPNNRFHVLSSTNIPRLYHSTANLLPDGRILVGGSNPNVGYSFSGVLYPTELRIEAYSPYYLDGTFDNQRPSLTSLSSNTITYGSTFTAQFSVPSTPTNVEFRLYAPPFTTHSYSMNQRQLILSSSAVTQLGGEYTATITAPPGSVAAPAGYYLLFAVNSGIPSQAQWVQIS